MKSQRQRIVVGITGASGAVLGIRLLQALKALGVETHLVVSQAGAVTLAVETRLKLKDVQALADRHYANQDIAAPISSGSFKCLGMIVAPCSTRTAAEIATGVTSGLLTRAADVTLKERRRLVLMLRETPLHTQHLRNLRALSEMGAVIAPPMPA
ncbi:MAG: UbiX family flavin prenyltransferase, partial [Rhodospirillales bacterium]